MKKLLLMALASAALSLSALDITTNDGKTYKNVSVSSITPIGFDISYTDKNGDMLMRGLNFTNLPKKIQEKFNYKSEKAAAFKKKTKLYQDQRIEKRIKQAKNASKFINNYEHIKAMVYARRMNNVLLSIIRSTHGGVIADVQSQRATLTSGQYGRIFVFGVQGGNGSSWNGVIYPTGTWVRLSDGNYPAFSCSLDMATMSVRRKIHRQGQTKKEKK